MAMQVIAEVTSVEELQQVTPTIEELPKGTRGIIEIEGAGLGVLADGWGAEQIAAWMIDYEVKIIDVYGEGWDKAFITFEAIGVAFSLIAVGLMLLLTSLGITTIIMAIRISADLIPAFLKEFKWIPISIAAVAAVGVVLVLRR